MGKDVETLEDDELAVADFESKEITKALLHGHDDHKSKPVMSNFRILLVASLLFGSFAAAEIIGALASNSLSLLGDGAAMSIDVFTYVFNMYAEHQKEMHGKLDGSTKRILEVYAPTFSVCALLGVTAWISYDAITIIIHGGDDGEDVDVSFMFGFAAANFVVDAISTFLFYLRGESVLVTEHNRLASFDRLLSHEVHSKPAFTLPNLNMLSALTHIGSDTMRTTSVLVAAFISKFSHQDSSLCDSWAAVIVSCTIVAAIMPLCKEIYLAATGHHEALHERARG